MARQGVLHPTATAASLWRYGRLLALALLAAALGCAQTRVQTAPAASHLTNGERVLIVAPDVVLYELNASGLLEPKAEWTQRAEEYVVECLKKEISGRGESYELYHRPGEGEPGLRHTHDQLFKLHDAVTSAILTSVLLPTKKGSFDWNLGPGTRALEDRYASRYALFVLLRDSYATGGRKALIVTGALLGLGIPGGGQRGAASLVDLHTGALVWFNFLSASKGDLRTPEEASIVVTRLLQGFPL